MGFPTSPLRTASIGRAGVGSGRVRSHNSELKSQREQKGLPWPVVLFLVGLVIPWIIPVGPMNMSFYRFVLLASLPLCLFMWIRGKCGPIRIPDICLVLFCCWASVSLIVVHGLAFAIQPAGMLSIETLGAYFLARCFIRSADDYYNMILVVACIVFALFPFAAVEWITGSKPILSAFGMVFPTVEVTMMVPRWGFWRVQGPFSHSIEFGVFCSSILAATYLVLGYGRSITRRWLLTAGVGFTAFLSMSSAPIGTLVIQSALIAWGWILRRSKARWKILWGIAFAFYLVIEFGSNQTPIKFYISRFTFDQGTGWYRLAIWDYGSASVMNHPLFGIGFGNYVRPAWMASASVDNFWLVNAMRHGLPAGLLILGASLWAVFAVGFKKGLDSKLETYRTAYVISMASFIFAGSTIHFSAAPYTWFLFALGSGMWLLDAKPNASPLSGKTVGSGRDRTTQFRQEVNARKFRTSTNRTSTNRRGSPRPVDVPTE